MVTVYTKPNCVQCNMTKKYLDDRKVEYSIIDITKDSEALDKIINQGFKAAPVVDADGEWWAGFQPDLIDKHIVN